jgi:excinuclease ABC subunit B
MYADTMTGSMQRALDEMARRREKQLAYNKEHGITPRTVQKAIADILGSIHERDYVTVAKAAEEQDLYLPSFNLKKTIQELKRKMKEAADKMEFEKAVEYRDRLLALERRQIEEGL